MAVNGIQERSCLLVLQQTGCCTVCTKDHTKCFKHESGIWAVFHHRCRKWPAQELEHKKELPFKMLCLYDGQIVAAFLLLPRRLLFFRFLFLLLGVWECSTQSNSITTRKKIWYHISWKKNLEKFLQWA